MVVQDETRLQITRKREIATNALTDRLMNIGEIRGKLEI